MDTVEKLKELIPDYAKDVRLTLTSLLTHPALPEDEAYGVALAASFAAKSPTLTALLRQSDRLDARMAAAAQTAAALMGMTNAWYSYLAMSPDGPLQDEDPGLRMTAYGSHGGVAQRSFELFALAASIVGRCRSCTYSHVEALHQEEGVSIAELREVGRIVAAVSAAAQVLAAEGKP